MLYNMGEVSYNQIGTYAFELSKEREGKIHCCLSTLSSKPENWSFYVVVLTSTGQKCTKMRAARAPRSFFLLLTNNITAFWRCRLILRKNAGHFMITTRRRYHIFHKEGMHLIKSDAKRF